MLSDMDPFRHKLLKSRAKDPENKGMFIPMLESDIVGNSGTNFYLDKLEKIYRHEAYLKHLGDKTADTNLAYQDDKNLSVTDGLTL